jgi:L-rhamnose isomerase
MDYSIEDAYFIAKTQYEYYGIDVDNVLETLKTIPVSIHCWQGDDVGGFEKSNSKLAGGGIQATGNYPGKARNLSELKQDLEKVLSLIPGNHRVNLHAIYGDFDDKIVERNEIEPSHFQSWINWAQKNNVKLDFNPTLFSHPKANGGFTLSSKNEEIRNFWIEHVMRTREISAEIGRQLKDTCIHNIWIPDGMKDITIDRYGYRKLLIDSLDKIYSEKYADKYILDSIEGKLFGIESEAFVVGSHEFYLSYAIKNNLLLTLDTGHFHPTESVGDKISAILSFLRGIVFHISRGLRWDSDHVVILDDELSQIMEEIIKCDSLNKMHIALDYFDASINRIGAYVIGARATLIGLLKALLQPFDLLKDFEEKRKYFQRLAIIEEMKKLPFGSIWDYYCSINNVPVGIDWIIEVEEYERKILKKRKLI